MSTSLPESAASPRHREILEDIARAAMVERGLLPDFSEAAMAELEGLRQSPGGPGRPVGRCPARPPSAT